jgi:hypothetical protein
MMRTEAGKLAPRPAEKSGHRHVGLLLVMLLEEETGLLLKRGKA